MQHKRVRDTLPIHILLYGRCSLCARLRFTGDARKGRESAGIARDREAHRPQRESAGYASSVSAIGYPAGGGAGRKAREVGGMVGKSRQAGREEVPPPARIERPNDPAETL